MNALIAILKYVESKIKEKIYIELLRSNKNFKAIIIKERSIYSRQRTNGGQLQQGPSKKKGITVMLDPVKA
ncbi:hypothetical protein BpHYR1_018090 [Brachionus plicatilis]|uniref:Uncharacterized protein n=1 Tax=Brachionus plicatilis TaxID=10195 RepID=A0A3M7Q6V6_BRAPC|nr:hypothetical protein BpHYR1_018090 [Brachionus plicatilis]